MNACNFIRKRLQHSCFPVNIAKILRTHILKNICERLLLERASEILLLLILVNFIFQGIGQNLDRNELDQGIVRHSEEHSESTQTSKI